MSYKRSSLWSHFTAIHDTKFAVCNICKRKYSFKSSVTNLRTHLDRSHKYQINKVQKDRIMPQVTKRYGQIVEDLLKTVDGTTDSDSNLAVSKDNLKEKNENEIEDDENGIGTTVVYCDGTEHVLSDEHYKLPDFSISYSEPDFKKTHLKSTFQETKNKNGTFNTMKPTNSSKQTYNTDEFDVFGDVVAHKLRALKSRRVQCIVEFKINNILYNAEMGEYDEQQQNRH